MAILWRHSSHEIAAVEVLGYAHIPGNLSYIDRDRTVTQRNPKDPDIVIDQTAAEEDYLKNYAWRIGDVALRPLADHAPCQLCLAGDGGDPVGSGSSPATPVIGS